MNYKLLNEMIDYIEEHITDDVKYKTLAKIVGINDFILQRVFTFVTGISISEYIRKRRLSKAYEDLKLTNDKVIDIALKYRYDSYVSFSRAFKKEFNMTPMNVRKEKNKKFKGYPILRFNMESDSYSNLDYEVKTISEKVVYCIKVSATKHEDLLYKIRKLYKKIKDNGLWDKFNEVGQYGISHFTKDEEYHYYVGSKLKIKGLEKVIIKKGRYAVFNVHSREQKDIVKTGNLIYEKWLPSTRYKIREGYDYELYINDTCYIYIPLEWNKIDIYFVSF